MEVICKKCQRTNHDSIHWTLKILNILDFEFDVCRVAGAERNENMTANENLEAKSTFRTSEAMGWSNVNYSSLILLATSISDGSY